jgi:hypothetical protein
MIGIDPGVPGKYYSGILYRYKPFYGGTGTMKEAWKPLKDKYISPDGKATVELSECPGVEKKIKHVWSNPVSGESDPCVYMTHGEGLKWLEYRGVDECYWPQWAKEEKKRRDDEKSSWTYLANMWVPYTGGSTTGCTEDKPKEKPVEKEKPVDQWTWQELMEYIIRSKANADILHCHFDLHDGRVDVAKKRSQWTHFYGGGLCNALKKAVKWLKEQEAKPKPKPVEEMNISECYDEIVLLRYVVREQYVVSIGNYVPSLRSGSCGPFAGVQMYLSGEDYTQFVRRCLVYAREHPLNRSSHLPVIW